MRNSRSSMRLDDSRIKESIRLPLVIPIKPYLKDHVFEGKIILPAVEIMQRLAGSLQAYRPDVAVRRMYFSSFDRFLFIENDRSIEAYNALDIYDDGHISSMLITDGPTGKARIVRTKVHAVVDFVPSQELPVAIPIDIASALEGVCFKLSSRDLYNDLVLFGASYRNVIGDIYLSEHGGIAHVYGAKHPAPSEPLGSTFPLDGAFHVACAWGQRFHHIVAFPVGFKERMVVNPTMPGETYRCTVIPVSEIGKSLQFDIWIHDAEGDLREYIKGVVMKDISAGRIKPPEWVRSAEKEYLPVIKKHCLSSVIIDQETLSDFSVRSLSMEEFDRSAGMSSTRKKSYLSARIALKYLSRKLSGNDRMTPSSDIHTMMSDAIRPYCPVFGSNRDPVFCSVSHDRRFAVSVADNVETGVDIEMVSERIMKVRHTYMSQEEMALTDASPLGVIQASIRIWSIKECVSKATDTPLPDSWKQVMVNAVENHESRLRVAGVQYCAFHDTIDNHIVTLVKRES